MVLVDTEVGLNARQFLAVIVTANARKTKAMTSISRNIVNL